MSSSKPDQNKLWDSEDFAARYRKLESYMARYARELVRQMGLSPSTTTPVNLIDLACGTGVVAKSALSALGLEGSRSSGSSSGSTEDSNGSSTSTVDPGSIAAKYKVTAVDLSSPMLNVLRSRIEAEQWSVKPTVIEADMRDTQLPSNTFTHLACSLGPCNAPNPLATLRESYRLLRPGGVGGWTGWMFVGWYPDLKAAIDDIRSAAQKAHAGADGQAGSGTSTEEDERLARMPQLQSFETMNAKFAGIDDLSTARDEDGETPKWWSDKYFASQVRKAGFVDVQVSVVREEMEIDVQDAFESLKAIVALIVGWWSDEEKKVAEGGLLDRKLQEWFQIRAKETGNEKVRWDDWAAMVVTGKKQ